MGIIIKLKQLSWYKFYISLIKLVITLVVSSSLLQGCSSESVLPSEKARVESPWRTFETAHESYELIIPNYTTVEELKVLGFDPYSTPNVHILTYLDIIERFIPNPSIKIEDLDPGIQRCIKARENCYALEATPGTKNKKRYGNALLDVTSFRKKTRVSGWEFNALVVVINDLAVYKISGGSPNTVEFKDEKTPLGPIQGLSDWIRQ